MWLPCLLIIQYSSTEWEKAETNALAQPSRSFITKPWDQSTISRCGEWTTCSSSQISKSKQKDFFFLLNHNQLLEVCVRIVSILQTWLHETVKAQYCVTWQGRLRSIIMVDWAGKTVGVEGGRRGLRWPWGTHRYYNLSQCGSRFNKHYWATCSFYHSHHTSSTIPHNSCEW